MFNPNIEHNTKKPSMNIVRVSTTIASVIITYENEQYFTVQAEVPNPIRRAGGL